GDEGAGKKPVAGAVVNGRLYTTETGGAFYETDLDTGAWKQVGSGDFSNAAFLFGAGARLCGVNKQGGLFNVNLKDGTRRRVGAAGAWKETTRGVVLNGKLYTVESSGGLYETNLDTG